MSPIESVATPRLKPSTSVALALVALYLIWGSTYLAIRYVVEGLPVFLSGGVRYVLAGGLLYVILRMRGARAPTRREWLGALPVGVLMFVGGNGFVALAEREVASSVAALVVAVTPIFASTMGLWVGERPSARQWLGMVIGFGGVLVLSLGDLRATPSALFMLLGATICWALGTQLSKRLPSAPSFMSAATQMLTGGVALLGLGFARQESMPHEWTALAVGSLAYLVVLGSLVAYSAFNFLVRNTSTPIAMSYAYVNPVVAVILGTLVGGEALGPSTFAAGALVLLGVALLVTGRPRRTP